jgi:hypothetical protein
MWGQAAVLEPHSESISLYVIELAYLVTLKVI